MAQFPNESNDASGIVWAFIATQRNPPGAYKTYIDNKKQGSIKIKKKNTDLWPKRPIWRRLGLHRCPTQPSRCIYNIYRTYIDIKKQVSIKIKKKNMYLWAMANDVSVV